MNKYKTSDKFKIGQLYHNYTLSTKCFDGNSLYDMFLANQRASIKSTFKAKDIGARKTAQS